MSSEIFYDKAFILVDDRYIPVVNHGSSNCSEFSITGHEVPEKHWSVLNYPYPDRMLFNKEEIQKIAAVYETVSVDNRGGTRKSRYRSFEEGEFGRWILAGMKSAHTVEEYVKCGNSVIVIDYDDTGYRKYSVTTTSDLLKKIEELEGRRITVAFWDNRHVTHPSMRKKGSLTDFLTLPEFYVLRAKQGYFVKRTSKRIFFTQYPNPESPSVRKFKTEKAALKYLQNNERVLSKYAFEIECVLTGGSST